MRAVIDTNVVFEGLTKQGGASRLVIQALTPVEFLNRLKYGMNRSTP